MERINVLVCAGTGCSSTSSLEIYAKFNEVLKERGLDQEVKVVKTGCFGFCQKGPVVVIYPDKVLTNSRNIQTLYLINAQTLI